MRARKSEGESECLTSYSSVSALVFSPLQCSTPELVNACEERNMVVDYILGALVAAGLLAYLGYALINPERF
jgi:K+-transporting ATPase KdpF subunit